MVRKKIDVPTSAPSVVVACQPGPTGADAIRSRILTIRGVQVMLDRDLAELYGVPTKRLNEQVKRNVRRFPASFMFQLTKEELEDWRSQIVTSNNGGAANGTQLVILYREDWRSQNATSNLEQYAKMGVRNRPYAFTEHGIIMLASVLKSDIAIDDAARAALYDRPSVQGSAVQLLWLSGRGDKADEHESSSREGAYPALFGIVKETCGNTARQSRAVRVGRLDDDGQGYCADTGVIHSTGRCIVLPSGKVISSGNWQRLGMS